ncbi:uncharacterized protein LOC144023972 isoform X2 [Festucalex cinctus]
MPPLSWVTSGLLVLLLFCNIICCGLKLCCSEKKTRCSRIRRSQSCQQKEDNPIYGNVNCMQSSATAISEMNPAQLTASSSSLRDQLISGSDLQSKSTDCYANLNRKAPQTKSACSSSQIQYSVVVLSDELEDKDKGNLHSATTVSDVYASVQPKRTKTVDNAKTAEDYANQI